MSSIKQDGPAWRQTKVHVLGVVLTWTIAAALWACAAGMALSLWGYDDVHVE